MPGTGDCDLNPANGCEAVFATDPQNCGGCNQPCSQAGGIGSCSGSTCSIQCDATHADCDKSVVDGCEADLTSPATCGSCTNACKAPSNATATCTGTTCGFQCLAGFSDCNMSAVDGCEIDTTSDPKNCGMCGHDCAGLGCSQSQCQAIVLASALASPLGIAADATYLYWSESGSAAGGFNDGRVARMPLAGGAIEVLASGLSSAAGLVLDAANVYVAIAGDSGMAYANGTIAKVPKMGGALTTLATAPGAFVLTTDGTTLFAGAIGPAANTTGAIYTVPMTGGPTTMISSNGASVFGVAVNATDLYFSELDNGGLFKVPKAGGSPVMLAPSTMPYGVALDATNVYGSSSTSVVALPLAGGAPVQLASTQLAANLLVDGATLYFTDFGTMPGMPTGSVSKVPVGGGAPVPMIQTLTTPFGMTTTSTDLYVAEYGTGMQDGTIRKMPK